MDNRYINAVTEDEFRATAYYEYVKDCNENYANLLSCITDIVSDSPEDNLPNDRTQMTDLEIENFVLSKLAEYNLDGRESVALPEGYTNLSALAQKLFKGVSKYADVTDPQGLDGLTTNINLTDCEGHSDFANISVIDALTHLKEQYHSSIVLESAMYASKFENAVDRLQIFKDNIETKFSNVYADISNSVEYFRSIIGNAAANSRDVVTTLFNSIGAREQADESNYAINQADVSQYTGANPIATLDFSTAKKLISATAKTIATAVANVAKSVWNVGKKLFNWARNKLYTTIVNPYDLTILNTNAKTKSIDGFEIQQLWDASTFGNYEMYLTNIDYTQEELTELASVLESIVGHWMKYETIFGEILFKFDAVTISLDQPTKKIYFANPTVKIKLKPVSRFAVANAFSMMYKERYSDKLSTAVKFCGVNSYIADPFEERTAHAAFYFDIGLMIEGYDHTEQHLKSSDIVRWLELITEQSDYSPDVQDDNEREMYLSFLTSWIMLTSVLQWSNYSTDVESQIHQGYISRGYAPTPFITTYLGSDADYFMDTSGYNSSGMTECLRAYIDLDQLPNTITNANFLNVACGYDFQTRTFGFNNVGITSLNVNCVHGLAAYNSMESDLCPKYNIPAVLCAFIGLQRADRILHPYSYAFIAYSNNTNTFNESRFSLKTDSQNQEALTKFLTTVVIVVVVAAVAVSSIVILKKVKRARYFKKADAIGKMDNQMWSSKTPLTPKQQKQYVRYSRKLNASNLLTSGMQETASNSISNLFGGSSSEGFDPAEILTFITG